MTSTEVVDPRQGDWAYAKALASARVTIPKAYRDSPGDVLLAMEYARALGLTSVTQVFNGVHVIDGKPGMSSALMQAVVISRGHQVVVEERPGAARCTVTRGDTGAVTTATFDTEDAKRAQLLPAKPGSGWAKYPQDLLVARAISRACRRAAPDALAGVIYTPDELAEPELDGGGVLSGDAPAVPDKIPRQRRRAPAPAVIDAFVPPADPYPVDQAVEDAAASEASQVETDEARQEWMHDLHGAFEANDAAGMAELITKASQAGWDDLADEGRHYAMGLKIRNEPTE